ncbi:hypothetical protein BSL78_07837 [Apostichopus japonicus]|uniref:VIT domain-containing protein n=1 Tax=Stichopus japonicus TaxID=307972 RepID=A0A2G8L4R6_STIJA|nr:hypothetical protein BSL78_07837 [Apostichopus japonicus]
MEIFRYARGLKSNYDAWVCVLWLWRIGLEGRGRGGDIDINKLKVFSNVSGSNAAVTVSMRFRNQNEERLYQMFTIRLSDYARVKEFKIDHMGYKVSARKMDMFRSDLLVKKLKKSTSTKSGIVMLRTSPYVRQYEVYVFLSPRSTMTFELKYQEKIKSLLAENLYEQIISVYPYQLVEDFQIDVTIHRPASGSVNGITAFWESFSVSSRLPDPFGLERDPLTIQSWNGGHRINLHPLRQEMQSPRTWQSDLIIFFEWESRGVWGFGGSSSSSSDASDVSDGEYWESLFSYDDWTPTPSTAASTFTPAMSPTESTAGGVITPTDYIEQVSGSGSGDEEIPSSEDSYSSSYSNNLSESEDSSYSSSDVASDVYNSDFAFSDVENDTTIVIEETHNELPYFKIYQKETSVEFKWPTIDGTVKQPATKFLKALKRFLKKLFPGGS